MPDMKNMADVKIEDLPACREVMPALSNQGYFNDGGQGTMPVFISSYQPGPQVRLS